MKKIFLLLICCSVLFASCYNPVFHEIRKEVKLTDATIQSDVNSIVRFTCDGNEYLVCQNYGKVYYKEADKERLGNEVVWTPRGNSSFSPVTYSFTSAEYKGEIITKLAADDKYLYLLNGRIERNTDGTVNVVEKKIYCTDSLKGDTWTLVDTKAIDSDFKISVDSSSGSASSIFCTNAIPESGRKAYFRNGKDLYVLNGSLTPLIQDKKTIKIPDIAVPSGKTFNEVADSCVVKSAVWFNGDVLFFGTIASTTDETSATSATKYYYAYGNGINYSSDTVQYYDETKCTHVALSNSGAISCMAVTKDCLLYGFGDFYSTSTGSGGIHKILKNADGSIDGTEKDFSTNASAVLTSSYQIITLLVTDPSKDELNNYIYASNNFKSTGSSISVSYDNVCLWAYYPTRGNWNRE